MALRLNQEIREEWKKKLDGFQPQAADWRPVPRAEPAPEKVYDTHTDLFIKGYVD